MRRFSYVCTRDTYIFMRVISAVVRVQRPFNSEARSLSVLSARVLTHERERERRGRGRERLTLSDQYVKRVSRELNDVALTPR